MTTFIKAEEQNYSLYNYVNTLNSEIDMIEEQNKNIEKEINRHEELGSLNDKEKENLRCKLREEIAQQNQMREDKINQITTIEGQMVEIKNNVKSMVDEFKKSHFFLSVA